MPLKKVISGGQTGVDQAALQAAADSGLETGGTIAKGFRTLTGPRPDLGEKFGLREHSSPDYPPRTFQNVRDADATIRIAKNFASTGELCTLKAITHYQKPHFDIPITNLIPVEEVAAWLESHDVEILNVAGNSEETFPGIYSKSYHYLMQLFAFIKSQKPESEIQIPVQESLPPEPLPTVEPATLEVPVETPHYVPTLPPAGPVESLPQDPNSAEQEETKDPDKPPRSKKNRKKGKETDDTQE